MILQLYQYSCPICGAEWYESNLYSIGDLGCPGCGRRFDLEDWLYPEEPHWHDWRQKCYDRMIKEYENVGQF